MRLGHVMGIATSTQFLPLSLFIAILRFCAFLGVMDTQLVLTELPAWIQYLSWCYSGYKDECYVSD